MFLFGWYLHCKFLEARNIDSGQAIISQKQYCREWKLFEKWNLNSTFYIKIIYFLKFEADWVDVCQITSSCMSGCN